MGHCIFELLWAAPVCASVCLCVCVLIKNSLIHMQNAIKRSGSHKKRGKKKKHTQQR